jgi:hypothetical protein
MEHLRLLDARITGFNRQHLRLRLSNSSSKVQYQGTLMRGANRQSTLTGIEYVNIIFKVEASDNEVRPDVWLRILDVEPVEKTD